jgi:hypothetical protein
MAAQIWWLDKRQNAKEKNAPKYINVGLRLIRYSLKYFDSHLRELLEK